MQATALSDKEPNSRRTLYLSIICTYLVLIVCVQFTFILTLRHDEREVVGSSIRSVPESGGCGSSIHAVFKRQINRGWQVCPPGCVRRRRKRPFGAIARPDSTIHPYSEASHPGSSWPGERGQAGYPGEPGWPGESGQPGWPGESGQPGWPGESGMPGMPGESGQPGWPGESGQPGWPGESGQPGYAGSPGMPGGQGSPGRSGLPGSPGAAGGIGSYPGSPGLPGGRGQPGGQGHAGQRHEPGSSWTRGYHVPRVLGPSGSRGQPEQNRVLEPGNSYNYNTYLGPSLRSGQSRGDQNPTEHPYPRNETSASKLLQEFRLYPHPECKDEVNHRALMDTLKDKGKVSFMILVDLQGSEYCIVHS